MKLTETDKKMFKMLYNSGTGKQLVDYLRRVQDHICDSRHWKEGDTRESALHAAREIENHIIRHASLQTPKKEVNVNQFS